MRCGRSIAHDPFLGQVRVFDQPKIVDEDEPDSPDAMALAISRASRRRRTQRDEPFALYVVESEGPPMVHVSRSRRSEIVIFGRQQKLLTPIVLGTGPILLNAAENDEKVELSKIVPSRVFDSDTRITSSLELVEVVRKTANLGATYPEIVTILEAAFRQRNLPGQLVVDAVPIARREYIEAVQGKDLSAKRDDSVSRAAAAPKPSKRWRLSIFGRSSDDATESSLPPATSKTAKVAAAPAAAPSTSTAGQPAKDPAADPKTQGNAPKSDDAAAQPAAKKDAAVQKATGEDPPPPRRSLLDWFRHRDDS